MASGLLPKSPVSSSLCDEVPHIFIPKSHLEPREFLISSAKRLLQQYLPIADIAPAMLGLCDPREFWLKNTRKCRYLGSCNFPFGLNLSTMDGRCSARVPNTLSIGRPNDAAICWVCSLPNAARS